MHSEHDNGAVPDAGAKGGSPLSLSDRVRSLKLPDGRPDGRGGGSWIAWLLAAAFACSSAGLAYAWWNERKAAPDAAVKGNTNEATVPHSPRARSGPSVLEASGFIVPIRKPQISPKVGGQVVKLYIEEGQLLEEGQVIADIDPRKYEYEEERRWAALKQAKAKFRQASANFQRLQAGYRAEEIASAKAQFEEAQETARQAQREADRAFLLGRATSPEEIERLQSRLTTARKREEHLRNEYELKQKGYREEDIEAARWELRQAEDALRQARVSYEEAVYDLQNTRVVAPFTGVVLAKNAEVGDMVLPNVPSNGLKASLVEMANLQELEVDVDVSDRNLGSVFKGQKCEVRPQADPDRVYRGVVTKIMPVANRSKASVSVRVGIIVPEEERLLRPEMNARVRFLADKAEE